MLKLLIAALFCAVLVMGTPFDYSIIDESNADPEVTFKSGMNDNFGPKASVESIRRLMGWKRTSWCGLGAWRADGDAWLFLFSADGARRCACVCVRVAPVQPRASVCLRCR